MKEPRPRPPPRPHARALLRPPPRVAPPPPSIGAPPAAAPPPRRRPTAAPRPQLMARVKTVRIWANVPAAAESGSLSSRLTTLLPIDWRSFDALKVFVLDYVAQFTERQDARLIQQAL